MGNRSGNNYAFLGAALVSFVSVIISIIILADFNRPAHYAYLPLLPLSYALINLVSYKIYKDVLNLNKKAALLLILLLFFIRNSLSILILYLGNYVSKLNRLTFANVNAAIVIMILETICVYAVLLNYGKYRLGHRFQHLHLRSGNLKSVKVIDWLLAISVVFCLVVYCSSGFVRQAYAPLWDDMLLATDQMHILKSQLLVGSLDRTLLTLFHTVFDFTRILLPLWILFVLRKKIGERPICVVICIVMCILQFSMMSSETIYVIIVNVVTILYTMRIYPRYRKTLLVFAGAVSAALLAYIFVWASTIVSVGANFKEAMSDMFQQYFPGIANVACAFNVVDYNKLNTLFFDIYETIPFHNTLFGLSGNRLSVLYNKDNGVIGTIVPCIMQAYHYLGWASPVVSCYITKKALDAQRKVNESDNLFSYGAYIIMMIYCSMTPVCYYPTILIARFLMTILPMIILSKLVGYRYRTAVFQVD